MSKSQIVFNAIAEQTYHIAVDGFSGAQGAIDLNINAVQPPVNDNFADSTRLAGSSLSVEGTNEFATGEPGEPDHAAFQFGGNFGNPANFNSSWWTWRAPASGEVTIDTIGSGFDTTLGIYTGLAVNSLTEIVSNDDSPGLGLRSEVTFNAVAGQTYHIAVDGWSNRQGSIDLNLDLDLEYTQVGTNAGEQLNGTSANDVIQSRGGDDQINGNGGHDYLEGNGGNDTIAGGSLSDFIDGGEGNDQLFGNGGGDEIFGGSGNDGLYGSSAADYLNGGSGDDSIYGNGGEDTLIGGGGSDTIYGGSQADEILGGNDADLIYGNGGEDTLIGGGGSDTIYGGSQADEILGGNGADLIYANGGNDLINGGNGIDEIWLGGGETVVLDANDTGYDIIRNFQLGQTTFVVNDINALSFADGTNGAEISQGGNLLATVSWQSASTFANNISDIFFTA
ncbi:MAG: calcium-binding protein [Symploca sp. SIO2E6]|nr:calcium-binding protein [Symploca sp. SIO2E6]